MVANCSCVVKALYLLVGQTVGSIVNPRMSRLREFCNIFYTLLLPNKFYSSVTDRVLR